MINRIAFYDFDATLMDTPMPDTGKVIWKEKTGNDYPHLGWWTKKESLDTNVFEIKPFPSVLSQLNKDTARPDTLTVLLTNRAKKLFPEVMDILKLNNIKFDEYSLHDGKGEKDDRIEGFIKKYPNVNEIDFFDDREKEILLISRLKRMVRDDNININVYRADKGNLSLVETNNKVKSIIVEEISKFVFEGKKNSSTKDLLMRSKNISKEMKEKILKYGGGEYKTGGFIKGLTKPKELTNKSNKAEGVSMGADKNGFYVYTHRARSKSYDSPEKIPVKDIEFIESTG